MSEGMCAGSAMRMLPQYQCHKKVWALKIENISGTLMTPEDKRYAPIHLTTEWLRKNEPQAGGYWVQYEDGYTSYSPAAAFESGYTLID